METFGQASGRPIVVVHQTMEKAAKVRETPPIPNILIANSRSGSGSESSVGTGNNPQSPISPKPRRRKLVVIGDGACGKTSLLVAYRDQTFTANYVPTVFENSLVSVPVENKTVDLALWDTAGIKIISSLYNHFSNDDTGQEDYDRLRPLSYPESNVILVCFAIDKPQSLANVEQKWVYELEDYCTGVPRILVGCKSDLRSQSPPSTNTLTTPSEALRVAELINAASYIECSAKTRQNVDNVFLQAARVSLTFQRRKKSTPTIITPTAGRKKCSIQ